MANFTKFSFNPVTGFENSTSYPDPNNEAAAREQLQRPLNQLREYINSILPFKISDTDVIQLKVNSSGYIQYSVDGENWTNLSVSSADSAATATSSTSATKDGSGNTITSYYQPKLTSGTTIKTINNQSILGSGNISIVPGAGTITAIKVNGTTVASSGEANITNIPGSIVSGTVANASSATTATKATQDGSGNTITTYYQKKITVSSSNPTGGSDGDIWLVA